MSDDQKYKINEWVDHPDVQFFIKKAPEEKSEDAKLRRFKDKYVFILGLGVIFCFFIICIYFIFQNPSNSLAMTSAFSIVSGFAGYILRGKS